MRIITNFRQLKRLKRPIAAIGIFDGVHLGHKRVFQKVVSEARRVGATSIVITFDPHPLGVLDIIGSPPFLVSLKHRLELIKREGIDAVLVINFNKQLARCGAEEFIEKVLVKKVNVREVIIGREFRFGKDKEGGIDLLKKAGRRFGFTVRGIPSLKIGGAAVSSTRIRRLIMAGRLREASRLLGRPAAVLGTVVKGQRRGRILGFPTANIDPHHEAIPPAGVYAVYVTIEGARYRGVLNIGFRPTFDKVPNARSGSGYPGDIEPRLEVHICDFRKKIYGKDIKVSFIKKLRDEKKFPNAEELTAQIRIDEHNACVVL